MSDVVLRVGDRVLVRAYGEPDPDHIGRVIHIDGPEPAVLDDEPDRELPAWRVEVRAMLLGDVPLQRAIFWFASEPDHEDRILAAEYYCWPDQTTKDAP